MERYSGVQGKKNVARIEAALEASGATIIERANPSVAPYEMTIKTPSGERHEIVCYAFTANEYKQKGRPAGEHRFQVKYGSDFNRYHELFFDPSRRKVTLMFGVHEDLDLFVAVDPEMHNPTWFSMSVEFKREELEAALLSGWHCWERERNSARRKREMPNENLLTEAVSAFEPRHFLRYIAFEKVASGMDTGERMLLWDKAAEGALDATVPSLAEVGHPLEKVLGLPAYEILDVVQEHFRLLVALRGSVAEYHLGEYLRTVDGVSDIESLDVDGQPDFRIKYEGREVLIECKNTLRKLTRDGHARVDFQKTRASKGNPCSRFYSPDQFEILAACMHPISEKWEYQFFPTARLNPHPKCSGRLATNVIVKAWATTIPDAIALPRSTNTTL